MSLLLSEMFECYKVDLLSLEKNPGPPEVVGQKRKGKSIVSLPVVSRKKNSSVSGTSSTKHDLTITENEDTETEGNVTEVDRRHEEREAKRSKTVGKPKEAFRIRPLVRTGYLTFIFIQAMN